jgi:hypothetical protein
VSRGAPTRHRRHVGHRHGSSRVGT